METLKNRILALSLALVMLLTLAACGGTSASSGTTDDEANATSSDGGKRVVHVVVGNAYAPFCYLDLDGEPAGYEYVCAQAVADYLSDKYDFVISADDWSNVFVGLDTGAYDVVAHHLGYTEARAENYLYATEPNMYIGNYQIGYLAGTEGFHSMEDLVGKTIVGSAGSISESLLNQWNENNPDKQIVVNTIVELDVKISDLKNGVVDGLLQATFDLDQYNKQYDNIIEIADFNVNDPDLDTGTYFIYNKGDDELQQDIDEAIRALREDGTLASLSQEWLGADYTENPNK